MIERIEFMKILAALAALYPYFKLKPVTIDAYYAILGDLDENLLEAATLQIGSEGRRFFPVAGELRQCAFDLLDRQADVPTAWDAWAEVCKRIGDTGYDRKWIPEFSHPLIKRAVDAVGGWLVLCMSENGVADRARFAQAYETLAKRERIKSRILPEVREAVERLAAESGADMRRLTEPEET